jgi:hypothetical protein
MQLRVSRITFTAKSTIGILSADGAAWCSTLELPVKDGLPGSAIPEGTYPVSVYPSPKFGRLMPLILGIPGRSNIEIHWGNFPEETDGCILLGEPAIQPDVILNSRAAFDTFWTAVQGPLERGEVTITINGEPSTQAIALDAGDQ